MSVDLSLREVSVAFGETEILRSVSLEVPAGEFVTLLGPSGSGKSTTLNVIAGFVKQTSGSVEYGGTVMDDSPPASRGVGFVFQNYALFPHMTAGENLAFPLRVRGVQRHRRSELVARYLELVALGGMSNRRASQLSGGQQQRVALARALVFSPRLLLLDEPLAALDKQLRESMQLELKRIQREVGVTTIAVTHDQAEAMTMSDRVAIMRAGRVEQFGAPQEVYRRPRNEFVARFLGEANLLPVSADGAVPSLGLRPGSCQQGLAVIRPEDLVVRAGGDGRPARVDELHYQGDRYRLVVQSESGERLLLSVPTTGPAPAVGDLIEVGTANPHPHVIAGDVPRPSAAEDGHAGAAHEDLQEQGALRTHEERRS